MKSKTDKCPLESFMKTGKKTSHSQVETLNISCWKYPKCWLYYAVAIEYFIETHKFLNKKQRKITANTETFDFDLYLRLQFKYMHILRYEAIVFIGFFYTRAIQRAPENKKPIHTEFVCAKKQGLAKSRQKHIGLQRQNWRGTYTHKYVRIHK